LGKLLIVYEEFNPTEEIVIGALKEAQKRGVFEIKVRKCALVTANDLAWADSVFVIRGHLWLTAQLLKRAKRMNRFCVAYWDDDYSDLMPGLVLSPARERAFRDILRLSDVIVSPNPLLAEKLAKTVGGKRTAVFDTIVRQQNGAEAPKDPEDTGIVRMVYAAGVGHTLFFDEIIRPALPELCERFGGMLALTFVGVHPDMEAVSDRLPVTYVDHIPLKEFRALMRDGGFDFGIAPLTEGGFFQYKYFNKFLEYSVAGIPAIYSDCVPYTLVVEQGVNGLLSENTPEGWISAIARMVEDKALRDKLRAGAKQTMRRRFSPEGVIERLLTAVPELCAFNAPEGKAPLLIFLRIGHVFNRFFDYGFYTMLRLKEGGVINTFRRIVLHVQVRAQAKKSEKQI
jgi:glycosyltransferase involved in cell wall biosynthesis